MGAAPKSLPTFCACFDLVSFAEPALVVSELALLHRFHPALSDLHRCLNCLAQHSVASCPCPFQICVWPTCNSELLTARFSTSQLPSIITLQTSRLHRNWMLSGRCRQAANCGAVGKCFVMTSYACSACMMLMSQYLKRPRSLTLTRIVSKQAACFLQHHV